MSSSTNDQVTTVSAVIRSSDERTEQLCAQLVKQQVPEEHISVIHERPFSKAVHRSFEIGLGFGLAWTLCIDADVLLREKAIAILVSEMEKLPDNTFALDGLVLDKLLGHSRPAGVHLYRTGLLAKALQYVGPSDAQIRPEYFIKLQMAAGGFPNNISKDVVIGLHDYEQFYCDIYRKCIVHAHKFAGSMPYATAIWKRLALHDTDYQVALWGYRAGKIFDGSIKIDRTAFPQELDTLLGLLGTTEKQPIEKGQWSPGKIHDIIDNMALPVEYLEWCTIRARRKTVWGRVALAREELGSLRLLPWLMGKILHRIAQKLEASAGVSIDSSLND